jgi:hypothetical protein
MAYPAAVKPQNRLLRIRLIGYSGSRMLETELEPTLEEDQVVPECLRAECTCPDFCERDHDQD